MVRHRCVIPAGVLAAAQSLSGFSAMRGAEGGCTSGCEVDYIMAEQHVSHRWWRTARTSFDLNTVSSFVGELGSAAKNKWQTAFSSAKDFVEKSERGSWASPTAVALSEVYGF
eukprot:GHVO01043786.1.p1 GENE.GHVO01043786.1~~GHVO01043786.1.p1  ORF type:complete len:121 (+),score=6.43 GHVO01043786.1:27-365(+)